MSFDVIYTLSRDEIADALSRAPLRRASTKRLIGQTIALSFVFVWCAAAFLLDETHEPSSLFIALAAAALAVVMWVVPKIELRRLADEATQNNRPIHLWVTDGGVDFGNEPSDKPLFAYAELTWFLPAENTCDTIVWRTPSYDVIVVPKTALTEEQWTFLMGKAV